MKVLNCLHKVVFTQSGILLPFNYLIKLLSSIVLKFEGKLK